MRQAAVALASGTVFAVGLGVAGMTDPAKVMGFLDFFGRWDPSLALVMVGAIGVNALVWWVVVPRLKQPLFGAAFRVPSRTRIDASLLGGAALFGVGWGLAGYCPGPAIASVLVGGRSVGIFVAAMVVGMWFFARVEARFEDRASGS